MTKPPLQPEWGFLGNDVAGVAVYADDSVADDSVFFGKWKQIVVTCRECSVREPAVLRLDTKTWHCSCCGAPVVETLAAAMKGMTAVKGMAAAAMKETAVAISGVTAAFGKFA